MALLSGSYVSWIGGIPTLDPVTGMPVFTRVMGTGCFSAVAHEIGNTQQF